MKKFTKVLALTLVAVMMLCMLASCGKKLSGSYKGEIDALVGKVSATYTFKGNKVEVVTELTVLTNTTTKTIEGTYEITEKDDGKMEITFTYEADDDTVKSGTYSFEEGEDYIKIGGGQYKKVEK